MTIRLDCLNDTRNHYCLAGQNDLWATEWYVSRMARPRHDWFLAEWLKALGKRQADLVRDLDWNKSRVSLMLRGEQQYTRDAVNEVCEYLNLRPYEILMHPDEANGLKRLRADLLRLAHASPDTPDAAAKPAGQDATPMRVSLG